MTGYAHSFATFRFVVSVFALLIVAGSIGQWWTFHTIQNERAKARQTVNMTLCDILRIFTAAPRTDLTPEQEARRQQLLSQADARLHCDPPLR